MKLQLKKFSPNQLQIWQAINDELAIIELTDEIIEPNILEEIVYCKACAESSSNKFVLVTKLCRKCGQPMEV